MIYGTICIANDLLGVVVGSAGDNVAIRDKTGKVYYINGAACTVVTPPHALAALLYNKLLKKLDRA